MSLATLRPDGVIDLRNSAVTGAATADAALNDDSDSSYASFQDNSTSTTTVRPSSWDFSDLIGTIGTGANWQQHFTSDGLNHPVDGFSPLEVSDNDDGSYLFNSSGALSRISFGLGAVSIPALAQITRVRARVRFTSTATGFITAGFAIGSSFGPADSYSQNTGGSVVEADFAWDPLAPDNSGWTVGKLASSRLVLAISGSGASTFHIAELFVDVEYENEPSLVEVSFSSVTIPTNSQIRSVTPRIRHSQSIAPQSNRVFAVSVAESFFPSELLATESGLTTQTGQARAAQPDGSSWTQAALDALTMRMAFYLPGSGLASFNVAEAYLDVVYNQPMVPTGTGPNAVVTTTTPTFTWTATDPDGDAQERYRIKVFADYQIALPGFDPNTSTPVVDSGEVFSGDQHWTTPVHLFGHTYRAYIWLADVGSNGRYNIVTIDGPYAWCTSPTVPISAPSLSIAEPPNPGDPFEIEILGNDNELSAQGSDFEQPTSSADVGEWTGLTNATVTCESGVTGAPTGTHAMNIKVSASGDANVSTATGLSAIPIPAGAERWGVVWMQAATTVRQVRAELHWFDVTGALIDTTLGDVVANDTASFIPAFVHGASIYVQDAVYVALSVTILSGATNEHHRLDNARISPYPINQMLTPGFDLDSDGNGLADNWSLVNTGGDADPVPTIDRTKVWGGSASQRLDWSANSDHKGVQQLLAMPAGAVKVIQVWLGVECATSPTYVEVLHDFLPNPVGPVQVPNDGSFVPVTMQLTNSGGAGNTGTLKIVSLQDNDVTMWIGGVIVLDQDPGAGLDWGAQFDGTGQPMGGPKDILAGPFTHGGATSTHHYELQRSIDNGATWITLDRAATNGPDWELSDLSGVVPAPETQIVDAFDFEAPTMVTVMYRARAIATLDTGVITSDWGRWWPVVAQSAGWQILTIDAPANSLVYENPLEELTWPITYETKDAVEHPLGRSYEVVMSDAVTGAHIPFDAHFTEEEEYEIYTAIRISLTPILHRTPWGQQFYTRFVGTHTIAKIVDGDTFQVLRTVSASLVEIDMP